MPLLEDGGRVGYKPFEYPWAYQAWEEQQNVHWMPHEVTSIGDDIHDWNKKLTESERKVFQQILRFFTQSDIEVSNCYMKKYSNFFKPVEINMMLAAFSNMETIHVAAYSHLIDTLGLPESEYDAFMDYKEMRDKHEFLDSFDPKDTTSLLETMAVFGAFTEGLVLFASFVILVNFQRLGLMKGTGQIITWSIRDETLHCHSIIKLFHTLLNESPDVDREALKARILKRNEEIIELEDKFIDAAFDLGEIRGLTKEEVKSFIRYIDDMRLKELGYEPVYNISSNPLPWTDELINGVEYVNFFENRPTDYAKSSTSGDWKDVWDNLDDN